MNSSDALPDIKAVITDIDGVLTDGSIGYGCGSDDEIKIFNVKDGTGFQLARCAGLKVACISGRCSKANRRRLTELHFDVIKEQCLSKKQGIQDVCDTLGIKPENCMYLGDDIIDIPAFEAAGLAVAVQDADELTKTKADWITQAPGGHGAAREAIERLLKLQGTYDTAVNTYLHRDPSSPRLGQ